MAIKLIESAQARWRVVNAPHLVTLVRAGATCRDGNSSNDPATNQAMINWPRDTPIHEHSVRYGLTGKGHFELRHCAFRDPGAGEIGPGSDGDLVHLGSIRSAARRRHLSETHVADCHPACCLGPYSVGVQGDGRTYGHPVVLRPVSSEDAMTADWSRLPYDLLEPISTRITNEVDEINRVALDVTSKPPGTIEWE